MQESEDYAENWTKHLQTLLKNNKKPKLKVLVLATPRTASHYFAYKLRKLLNLNYITREYFNQKYVLPYLKDFNLSFDEYMKSLFCTETLIINCQLDQYIFWLNRGYDILEYFDLVCYLKREDTIAQAKSFAIGTKTKVWRSVTSDHKWGTKYVMEEIGMEAVDITEEEMKVAAGLIDYWTALDILSDVQHTYRFEDYINDDKPIHEFIDIINQHNK